MRWTKAAVVASVLLLLLGLAGDPGGLPIYKNGLVAGAIGVEGDGLYSFDAGLEGDAEEDVAVAAQTPDYAAPATIRADRSTIDGVGLPFVTSAGADPRAAGPAAAVLVGAIGVSGDGIEQDDMVAAAGAAGFAAPAAMRSDRTVVRGVRLPY